MNHFSGASPLVSVIIPTYNRPIYLKQAIASVLNQTFQSFEIIVSDDGSLENPEVLVKEFNDSRIRFRRNGNNLGVAWNVTYALQLAQGHYIACLNDDDTWEKDFLEKLVPPLELNPELVLAFCDYSVIDLSGVIQNSLTEQQTFKEKRDRLQPGMHHPFYKIGLVDQSVFASSAAVLRRDAIAWNELPQAGVFWDYYLVYLACRSGQGAYYCSDRLANYRVHPESENMRSGSRDAAAKIRKGQAGVVCYEKFAQDAPNLWIKVHFQREWVYANTTLGIGLMRNQQFIEARPYLLRSLRCQPLSIRTVVALVLSYMPRSFALPFVRLPNPGLLSKVR